MQALNGIISGLCCLLCTTVLPAAETPAGPQEFSERIRAQQERLPEIERAVAREREQVQQWYQRRRDEAGQQVARKVAAEISFPLRIRWVEFMKMQRGLPHPAAYFDASYYGFVAGPAEFAYLRQAMEQEYFITEMAQLLMSEDFEEKLEQIVYERLRAPLLPLLREEAADVLALVRDVRTQSQMELRQLEDERNARLDATMEWEKDLKQQVHDILEYLRESESREAQLGVVESVGYCPESGYFCMIQGVDRVLGAGDRVGSIRVLSIDPEKVEFARNGSTWVQELGAPPPPFWDQAG